MGDPYGAVSCAELMELARRKGKPIPLAAGLRIAKEVLEHLDRVTASSQAKVAGFPWSAVSLQAIFVGPSGEVSICAAEAPGSGSDPIDTEHSDDLGTDERDGPFSVGAVLYQMLTGNRLFGEGEFEPDVRADEADLSAIAEPTVRLPLELRLILASALAREPDEGFEGVRDFADAIYSFAHHAHMPLGPVALTSWLASLDLWPTHSGMFPKSDLDGVPENPAERLEFSDAPRRRVR